MLRITSSPFHSDFSAWPDLWALCITSESTVSPPFRPASRNTTSSASSTWKHRRAQCESIRLKVVLRCFRFAVVFSCVPCCLPVVPDVRHVQRRQSHFVPCQNIRSGVHEHFCAAEEAPAGGSVQRGFPWICCTSMGQKNHNKRQTKKNPVTF